jgi:hypothetical protein
LTHSAVTERASRSAFCRDAIQKRDIRFAILAQFKTKPLDDCLTRNSLRTLRLLLSPGSILLAYSCWVLPACQWIPVGEEPNSGIVASDRAIGTLGEDTVDSLKNNCQNLNPSDLRASPPHPSQRFRVPVEKLQHLSRLLGDCFLWLGLRLSGIDFPLRGIWRHWPQLNNLPMH